MKNLKPSTGAKILAAIGVLLDLVAYGGDATLGSLFLCAGIPYVTAYLLLTWVDRQLKRSE